MTYYRGEKGQTCHTIYKMFTDMPHYLQCLQICHPIYIHICHTIYSFYTNATVYNIFTDMPQSTMCYKNAILSTICLLLFLLPT